MQLADGAKTALRGAMESIGAKKGVPDRSGTRKKDGKRRGRGSGKAARRWAGSGHTAQNGVRRAANEDDKGGCNMGRTARAQERQEVAAARGGKGYMECAGLRHAHNGGGKHRGRMAGGAARWWEGSARTSLKGARAPSMMVMKRYMSCGELHLIDIDHQIQRLEAAKMKASFVKPKPLRASSSHFFTPKPIGASQAQATRLSSPPSQAILLKPGLKPTPDAWLIYTYHKIEVIPDRYSQGNGIEKQSDPGPSAGWVA
ncbi:hypothetical protein B0H13DRAFT_1887373 [Mycena leptocephala]|nr:hypothetical protein B0H13DRAFT_1887373 [Mycena leptocephala]